MYAQTLIIHACTHTHTHTRTPAHTHAYTHARTHTCTHTRTHARTHARRSVNSPYIVLSFDTLSHTHTRIHINIHTQPMCLRLRCVLASVCSSLQSACGEYTHKEGWKMEDGGGGLQMEGRKRTRSADSFISCSSGEPIWSVRLASRTAAPAPKTPGAPAYVCLPFIYS